MPAVGSGEAAAIAEAVEHELPPSVRNTSAGWSYLRQRVEQLLRDGLAPELDTLWREPAVPDEQALTAFRGRALVIDLPGCISRGATEVEAVENARGAIRSYLWMAEVLAGDRATVHVEIPA